MRRYVPQISAKSGMPPGSLVYIGEKKDRPIKMTRVVFNAQKYEKQELTFEQLLSDKIEEDTIVWYIIDGLNDVEKLDQIGKKFNIENLVMEDAVNTGQRPKLESFKDYLFLIAKDIESSENNIYSIEQLNIILGKNFVLTLSEDDNKIINVLADRISEAKERFYEDGADYLAYTILDTIIDKYFIVIEDISERLDDLEKAVIENPTQEILGQIHWVKKELLLLHKTMWSTREAVSWLIREDSPLVDDKVVMYFRDIHDHLFYIVDTIDIFRDMLSGMLDIYFSSTSKKMNEIMKVLTVISTIFIPLTFIAGVYGMNFKYMPELSMRYGYPVSLLGMLFIAGLMLLFFQRKKWF